MSVSMWMLYEVWRFDGKGRRTSANNTVRDIVVTVVVVVVVNVFGVTVVVDDVDVVKKLWG